MKGNQLADQLEATVAGISRRKFFGLAGGIAGVGLLAGATGCKNNDDDGIDLGSGDVGILNYAYALEQLEAAFYTRVVLSFYNDASPMEKTRLQEIRDHEIAHREFFKAALGSAAIPALEVNFTSIDFTNRLSVLGTAKAFEDLGVSAYNGAGKLIVSKDYLTLAGKIVSVEARHAAYIRDIITPGTFANSEVLDADALEKSKSPGEVLSIAGAYLYSSLNAGNLPTS